MKLKVILGSTLIGVAALAMACGSSTPAKTPPAPAPAAPAPAATNATVVTLTQTENPYAWAPKNLDMRVGKPFQIKITGGKELHSFKSDDLKIPDTLIKAGQTITINVTPSAAGTFKFVCTVHESLGQAGTITVK